MLEAIEQSREDNIFATLELLGSDEMTFSATMVFDRWSAVFVFHATALAAVSTLLCALSCSLLARWVWS